MHDKEIGKDFYDSALNTTVGRIGDTKANFSVLISPRQVVRFLFFVILGLTLLSLIGHFSLYFFPHLPFQEDFVKKFALNKEQNFPTLYSSLALFFSAVLLFIISHLKVKVKDRHAFQWRVLAGIFIFMALDEIIGLHELLSKPFHRLGFNGVLHNAWLVPGFVILLVFCISFARFFFHFPRRMRNLLLLAALLFVGGAFVMELIDGYYAFLHGKDNIGYALLSTIEECLEMLGVLVFIYALLTYLTRLGFGTLNVKILLGQSLAD